MKIDGTPSYTFTANIQSNDIIGGWFFKKLKMNEAKLKFMSCYKTGIRAVTTDLVTQSLKSFNEMVDMVNNKLQYLVSTYNPKLLRLSDNLKECNSRIDYMKKQESQIERNMSQIESLTSYKISENINGGQI